MDWIGLQRRMRQRLPQQVWAVGYSRWKKPIVRRFLGGSDVRFVRSMTAVPAGANMAVWGCRDLASTPSNLATAPRAVLRLEDGFLRSVGLGADLVRPLSWVADATGLYYDATRPSDLDGCSPTRSSRPPCWNVPARCACNPGRGITKYNVGRVRGRARPVPRA